MILMLRKLLSLPLFEAIDLLLNVYVTTHVEGGTSLVSDRAAAGNTQIRGGKKAKVMLIKKNIFWVIKLQPLQCLLLATG